VLAAVTIGGRFGAGWMTWGRPAGVARQIGSCREECRPIKGLPSESSPIVTSWTAPADVFSREAPTGGGRRWDAEVRAAARGPYEKGVPMSNAGEAITRLRRPSVRLLALLVALVTALFIGSGASTASAKPRTADPTTVTINDPQAGGGNVAGTFDVSRFAVQNGQLVAIGTFTGTVTDAAGTSTSGSQQIALPVDLQQSTGSCEILDLVLGPLDLNLLGLEVHLDQVHLNITAQSGPGNLLGNLLCAIAGLLDGPTGLNAILTQIANLLNQILAILG
jgi:hypothetical protein